MKKFAACTIVAHNYLPQARILASSFKKHHPESDFVIVLVDWPHHARVVTGEEFQTLSIRDIDFGVEGWQVMASIYDVTEFATSVKPFALRHLVEKYECVFYIDPDIEIFAPLSPLVEMTLEFGWSLTPHSVVPMGQSSAHPTEEEIKGAGIFNLGYVGVTKRLAPMLDWWCDRLRRECIVDVPHQLFTDQRWIDMAAAIWPAYIERQPSYNVAYWNLDKRRVTRAGVDYFVDGDRLRFLHFSGYDPDQPHWISKYIVGRPRALLSEHPVAAELFASYGERLSNIKDEIRAGLPYGWGEIVPGLQWTKGLRRYFREQVMRADLEGRRLPTPYDSGGASEFVSWVKAPGLTSLPRYLEAVYFERYDLQSHFPEVSLGQTARFLDWVNTSGVRENEIIRIFGWKSNESNRSVPPISSLSHDDDGVDVIGYLTAELGVGEAARLLIRALESTHINTTRLNFSRSASRTSHQFSTDNAARFQTLIAAVNADQLPVLARELPPGVLSERYVIGQWFWELEEFPSQWTPSFGHLDEVWAPTKFIKDAIERVAPSHVPVVHMPLPIVEPSYRADLDREHFGFSDDFIFLFVFDFLSVMKRKNPIGLLDAYTRAFPRSSGTRLIIKTINGDQRIKSLEEVRWHARSRPDISVIDGYFDSNHTASLIRASDCYVSLHRSEGLGLTMAEAMMLGKPVIATNYGGNCDFMSEENSFPVPWSYVPVGPHAEGYSPSSLWAEPDLDVAASLMRQISGDRSLALRIGELARRDLSQRFSISETGQRMRSRIMDIQEREKR